jgi:hypothetical protein
LRHLLDEGGELGVAEDVGPAGFGAAEVVVELRQREFGATPWVFDLAPGVQVGRRVDPAREGTLR